MDKPWWTWTELLLELGLVLRKKPAKPHLLKNRRLVFEPLEPRKLMTVQLQTVAFAGTAAGPAPLAPAPQSTAARSTLQAVIRRRPQLGPSAV